MAQIVAAGLGVDGLLVTGWLEVSKPEQRERVYAHDEIERDGGNGGHSSSRRSAWPSSRLQHRQGRATE